MRTETFFLEYLLPSLLPMNWGVLPRHRLLWRLFEFRFLLILPGGLNLSPHFSLFKLLWNLYLHRWPWCHSILICSNSPGKHKHEWWHWNFGLFFIKDGHPDDPKHCFSVIFLWDIIKVKMQYRQVWVPDYKTIL